MGPESRAWPPPPLSGWAACCAVRTHAPRSTSGSAGEDQKSKRKATISPRIVQSRLPDSFVVAILSVEIELGNLKRTGAMAILPALGPLRGRRAVADQLVIDGIE